MATKAPAKAPESADAAKTEAPAKSGRKKWIVIALVAVLLLGGGGGAAWYFLSGSQEEPVDAKSGKKSDKAADKSKKADPGKPPVFVSLETFTVNLQPEAGDHVLQTTFSLKVNGPDVDKSIKTFMPEVRSRLLLLLSSKKPSELATIEGKQALADQIAGEVNKVLQQQGAAEAPVLSVFFTNFIIQ
jgi:flagellar FliL protein